MLHRVGRMEVPDPATGGTTEVSIGPDYVWDISTPARTRYRALEGYRPPSLTPFDADLRADD